MQISSVSASPYMQQMQQAMFQKADSNDDGSLSLDEFSASGPEKNSGSANAAEKARAEKLFKTIDTDGDGKASETEMGAFISKLSAETQSSLISLQQTQGGQGPMKDPMSDLMDKADSDGDGMLSLDEFNAAKPDDVSSDQSDKMFGEMDSDGDGKVTQDELKTFAESHRPDQAAGAGQMPPPPPSGGKGEGSGSSLADILASVSSSSTSDTSSTNTLADLLNQASGTDDTSSDSKTDLAKQLSAYVSQMLSAYADQAKSGTSSLSISA